MKIISTILFASLFVLGLTACDGGGGGSDDGDAPPAPVPLEPVVINQDNAEEVVTAVMAVVGIVGDLGAGGVLPMQDTGVKTPELTTSEADFPQADLFDLLANTQSGIQVAAAEALTVPCLVSGSMDVVADIADPSGELLAPGDSISMTFLSCDDGDGALLNGNMGMVVVVPPVDTAFTAPYDYTFDITLADFSVTEAGETTVANGDLSTREATYDGIFFETELAGHKLRIESGGITEILMEFRLYGTYNAADGKYTIDAGGFSGCCATLASDLLGGAVEYENTLPFEGVGDGFPFAGALMITGGVAEGGVGPSAVELIAVNAVIAGILLDENGDEFFEASKSFLWESIMTGIPGDDEIGPEPDTVTVGGREWAQVDQFTNLSWSDINAVCPAGVCSAVLNGYNMTGWTWASVDDVNALFNHYIGSDELGPGPVFQYFIECSVVLEFINDGWRSSYPQGNQIFAGMIQAGAGPSGARYAFLGYGPGLECVAGTGVGIAPWPLEWRSVSGGYFWRVP